MYVITIILFVHFRRTANTNVPHIQADSGTRGTDGSVSSEGRGSEDVFF